MSFWDAWYMGEELPGFQSYIAIHQRSGSRMWVHETYVMMSQHNGGWSSFTSEVSHPQVAGFMIPAWLCLALVLLFVTRKRKPRLT